MADTSYDVVVIGSGPGGYVCAIRASQLGLSVAVVEQHATLGGTCLNVGCIPSKALLHASNLYAQQASLAAMGITATPKLNLRVMQKHKAEGVAANVKGVNFLMRKHNITVVHGVGTIMGTGKVQVANGKRKTQLSCGHIVIATGSRNIDLPNVTIDETRICSSTGALAWEKVPRSLLIIGAGVIGLELGSVWARLGAKVRVVELENRIALGADAALAQQLQKSLIAQGMEFLLGHRFTKLVKNSAGYRADVVSPDGKTQSLPCSHVLVAVGRCPQIDGLGIEKAKIELDKTGRIRIDEGFATSLAGVYAIGDVVHGAMLAHKASDEGVALAERLAGQNTQVNYAAVPNVIYTAPEAAWVGQTEDELKANNIAYRRGQFPLTANARAKINASTDGFVKLLSDERTDRLLGAHLLAPNAGDMIGEMVVAMEFGASAEDIARSCHAHPTVSEAIQEAALAVDGRARHM